MSRLYNVHILHKLFEEISIKRNSTVLQAMEKFEKHFLSCSLDPQLPKKHLCGETEEILKKNGLSFQKIKEMKLEKLADSIGFIGFEFYFEEEKEIEKYYFKIDLRPKDKRNSAYFYPHYTRNDFLIANILIQNEKLEEELKKEKKKKEKKENEKYKNLEKHHKKGLSVIQKHNKIITTLKENAKNLETQYSKKIEELNKEKEEMKQKFEEEKEKMKYQFEKEKEEIRKLFKKEKEEEIGEIKRRIAKDIKKEKENQYKKVKILMEKALEIAFDEKNKDSITKGDCNLKSENI